MFRVFQLKRIFLLGLVAGLGLGISAQAQADDEADLTITNPQNYAPAGEAVFCPGEVEGYLLPRLTVGEYGVPLLAELFVFATPSPGAEIIARVTPEDDPFLVLDGPFCAESAAGTVRWWWVWWPTAANETPLGWVGASDGARYTAEPAPNPRPETITEIIPTQRALSGAYTIVTEAREVPAGTRLDAQFAAPQRPEINLISVLELQPNETVIRGEQITRFRITIGGEFAWSARNEAPGPLVVTYRPPDEARVAVTLAPQEQGPGGAFGANTSQPILPRPTPTPATPGGAGSVLGED